MHYLIDESDQCYATIPEPRCGNILYVTDIRVQGVDRSFISLDAAKQHAECEAVKAKNEDASIMYQKVIAGNKVARRAPRRRYERSTGTVEG